VILLALLAALSSCAGERGSDGASIRIVAYNIKHGRGMDDRVDLERIADVLRQLDADVITLQEVDDRTERTAGVDQVAVLAELLGYYGAHGPHRPYQGGFYGNAVLTRLPVLAQQTHAIPPASGSALAVHELQVALPGGEPVSVVSVHLAGSPEERMQQADAVTATFAEVGRWVVLAGDFNGRPDDDVVVRLARDWVVLEKEGEGRTYPADVPDREIDFIMVRPRSGFTVVEHRVIAEALASDHRPVLVELRFDPSER
jgi:endonuclease/exonuclease/phosphatase family metal-dependent hydrolase